MDRKRKFSQRAPRVLGTTECPRLAVFKSSRHIYAQIIDDAEGKTLAYASTIKTDKKPNLTGAKWVGETIAGKAKAKNIERVVFDRRVYRYHGCVAALADAVREGGLKF